MELPLFPLHLVLFPGSAVPLHVFEPRYRAMIDDLVDGDRTFGIVAIAKGMEAEGPAELHEVGCAARIDSMRTRPDGRIDLIASGRRRFRVAERLEDAPYPRARVRMLNDEPGPDAEDVVGRATGPIMRTVALIARAHGDDPPSPSIPNEPVAASFALAAALPLDKADRQRLLEAETAVARVRLAVKLARREAELIVRYGPSVGRPAADYSPN